MSVTESENRNIVFFFSGDRPLIVQFAAKNAKELADATEVVVPYVFVCGGI